MRAFLTFLVFGSLASLLSACASTSITSSRDPSFGAAKFGRIAVLSTEPNAQARQEIESSLVEMLRKKSVSAHRASLLLPAVASPSLGDMTDLLQTQRYQAVLVVRVLQSGISQERQPSSLQSTPLPGTSTYGALNNSASTGAPAEERVTAKYWADYGLKLIDLPTGKVVWSSRARATGNGYAAASTVLNSFAESAVQELTRMGLLSSSS